MSDQDGQSKSTIEESVRLLFRQGGYAEAVPVIRTHIAGEPSDIGAYELLADALRYSGDKPGAAAALATASDLYAKAGMPIQSIAAQKRVLKLGVEPDYSSIRTLMQQAPAAPRVPTPLFDDFSDDEFHAFVTRLAVKSFDAGEIVVAEGSPGDSMFVLASGALEVVTGQGAREVKLADLVPGDFFGEAALLSGRPRTATCRATAATECLVLSREDYDDMVTMHPRVKEVMEDFNRRRAESTVDALIRKKH